VAAKLKELTMNITSDALTTIATPFGNTPSGKALFCVQPDILLQEALEQIALNLRNMTILCDECCDSDTKTTRALNQIMGQLIDSSSGLLNSVLERTVQSERAL